MNLPGIPDCAINPDEPVMTFVYTQCRTCGERSEVTRNDRGIDETPWQIDHVRETRHREYYHWSLTRSTGRIIAP